MEQLKTKLCEIRVKVTEDLESDIRYQTVQDTFYCQWSALDLSDKNNV